MNSTAAATPHLLTFDLEHWYEGFRQRGLHGWEDYPPRDPTTVLRLLDVLAATRQRATCFTTGRFAREFPEVVKAVAAGGHEVASHSFEHIPIPGLQSRERFAEDLRRSLGTLGDITGEAIVGYRAPKWSINTANQEWVYEALAENGLRYDSSRFPHVVGDPRLAPHRVNTAGRQLWEVPPSVLQVGPLRLRAAGGLYLRLFPEWFTRATLRRSEKAGQPGLVYLHPYDMDPTCPRLPSGGAMFKFGRYYGLDRSLPILERLLHEFRFVPIRDWLAESAGSS